MTKNHRERIEKFSVADMRVLSVIDLGSLIGTDAFDGRSLPEEFDDLYEDENHHDSVKEIARIVCKYEDDPATAGEAFFNKGFSGLMLQVGTPVREFFTKDSCSFSWGRYYTGWVYAATYEQALELAFDWAKGKKDHDRLRRKEKS